jgi:hypothetical protein
MTKVLAPFRWAIKREPVLTAALIGAAANTLADGLGSGVSRDTIERNVVLAVLGVLARWKVSPTE